MNKSNNWIDDFFKNVDKYELPFYTNRNFKSIALSYTTDKKEIKAFIERGEKEVNNSLEYLKKTGFTDEQLTSQEKAELLANSIKGFWKDNSLSDNTKEILEAFEHRCKFPKFRAEILNLITTLNLNIVAGHNHYPYFNMFLMSIASHIQSFYDYEETLRLLSKIPCKDRNLIKLDTKIKEIVETAQYLKDNNFNINVQVYTYTAFMKKWSLSNQDNYKKLLRKILNLSNKSLISI